MNRSITRRQWFRRAAGAAAGVAVAPQVLAARPVGTRRSPPVDGLIRLSSNENPYGPSPKARAAMQAAFDEAWRYPYAGAVEDFVALIAEREGVTPEHVIVGGGSSEILHATGMAYGLHGGELLAANPTYEGMPRYAGKVGAYTHRVSLTDDLVHDLAAMDRRITPAVKLVFVCNPNNPTGTVVDPETHRDFISSVSRRAVVFVDEAYIELTDDPAAHTMVDLVRHDYNVIVSRTLSKIHGMAGARVGYALARPDIAERVRTFGMAGSNVMGLRGAIASLQDAEFQAFSRQKMAEGRQLIYRLCDEMGYRYAASQTNFVFFQTGKPIDVFQRGMQDQGILVGRPFPPYLDWARVSIGTEQDMQAFATALPKVMAV